MSPARPVRGAPGRGTSEASAINRVHLDRRREARLRLAFDAAYDARDGDPADYRRLLAALIELHERLWAEQYAELGIVPSTAAGRDAVLQVAEAIEQKRRRR